MKTPYEDVQGLPGAVLAEQGLALPHGLSKDAWAELYHRICKANKQIYWMIGDAILYGEAHYGRDWVEQNTPAGPVFHQYMRYRRVARCFPPDSRRVELSFLHHDLVCSHLPEDRWEWMLNECVEKGWNTKALKMVIADTTPGKRNVAGVRTSTPGRMYIEQKAEHMTKEQLEATMVRLRTILEKKDEAE